MVIVAQLAEHRIVVPSVAGSSPVFHPQETDNLDCQSLFFVVFACKKWSVNYNFLIK